jgi:pilus assembly protein Flp/PilA
MYDTINYVRIQLLGKAKTERGASAVEYGLLIAGIAALIVVVVFAFGGSLRGIFTDTCSKVTASASGTQSCS